MQLVAASLNRFLDGPGDQAVTQAVSFDMCIAVDGGFVDRDGQGYRILELVTKAPTKVYGIKMSEADRQVRYSNMAFSCAGLHSIWTFCTGAMGLSRGGMERPPLPT